MTVGLSSLVLISSIFPSAFWELSYKEGEHIFICAFPIEHAIWVVSVYLASIFVCFGIAIQRARAELIGTCHHCRSALTYLDVRVKERETPSEERTLLAIGKRRSNVISLHGHDLY